MRQFLINGATMTSKKEMYQQLNRLFSFPPYFGNNLDALWDVLNETDEPTEIHFEHTNTLLKKMEGYGEKLLKLFRQLEKSNSNVTVYFYPCEMDEEGIEE